MVGRKADLVQAAGLEGRPLMSTQAKPPGGKQQGTKPHGATQRKSGNQKAPKKIATEQTGAAKREEVAQTAKAAPAESSHKSKGAATDVARRAKAPTAGIAQNAKAAAVEPSPKAKTPAAEPSATAKASPVATKKLVSSPPTPELSKDAVSGAMETIELSWKAAGLGTVAVNRKILDFARQNVSSGLHLARSLAGATNPAEMARLHVMFWDEQMKALANQAEELRAMSAELLNKASEPLREHVRKSLSDLGR
jgi:hypothetical protein